MGRICALVIIDFKGNLLEYSSKHYGIYDLKKMISYCRGWLELGQTYDEISGFDLLKMIKWCEKRLLDLSIVKKRWILTHEMVACPRIIAEYPTLGYMINADECNECDHYYEDESMTEEVICGYAYETDMGWLTGALPIEETL